MNLEEKPVVHTCAKRLWVFSIIAGVLAGLSAWGAGEAAESNFPATLTQLTNPADLTQQRSVNLLRNLKLQMQKKKAAIAYGLLGGLLGVYLAVAGGLARRSLSDTPRAAVVGFLAGAIAIGLAYWLVPWYFRWIDLAEEKDILNDPSRGLIIHIGIWISSGIAAGLGLGLASGEHKRIIPAIIGGCLGVIVASTIYDAIGYTVLSADDATAPVPGTSQARLLAHLLVGVLTAVGAVWASTGLSLSLHKEPKPV